MVKRIPLRHSVRVLFINQKKELLFLCVDNPSATPPNGKSNGRFWFTPGGEVEYGESLQEVAIRELYEETGLQLPDITLGPIVWFGEIELVVSGVLSLLKQRFIVVHTKNEGISMDNQTPSEKKVIEKCEWFSLEKINSHEDIIYPHPSILKEYLPAIIEGNYPIEPIEIDLARQP